jgi:hypothetical protein
MPLVVVLDVTTVIGVQSKLNLLIARSVHAPLRVLPRIISRDVECRVRLLPSVSMIASWSEIALKPSYGSSWLHTGDPCCQIRSVLGWWSTPPRLK